MLVRSFVLAGCLTIVIPLSACGGGGGGGGGNSAAPPVATATPPPGPIVTPTPTATPKVTPAPLPTSVLPSAKPVIASAYAIDSNPQGLAITVDGSALGTTPGSATPAYSRTSHTIAIAAPGVAPFVVTLAQTANGPRTIYFNSIVDTQGKIASITATPFAHARRAMQFGRVPLGVIRSTAALAGRARFSDRRLVVRYDPRRLNATFARIESLHGTLSATTDRQSTTDVRRIITLRPGVALQTALHDFAQEPGVTSVDRVRLRYPLASAAVYPNDPSFVQGTQWYLNTIDTTDAWSYGLGKSSIAIAVIDTGYDPAQTEVAPGVTFAEKIVGGAIDSSAHAAADSDGHGTFAAGVASAQTNNGAGFAGVAYGAGLQAYKVFTDGASPTADSADVAEAIREAVAHKASVILLPFGGPPDAGPDALERDAVAFALASNVAVIAAAGNEGATALDYPAGYDGVISVGSSAINDTATPGSAFGAGNFEYVPTYSNSGPTLSLVAPGGDLTGAGDTDVIHGIINAYTTQPLAGAPACPAGTAPAACSLTLSGTSAAAAIVAGASALLLSQNPSLTPAQLGHVLTSTSDDIKDGRQGSGRLNLHAAAAALAGDVAPIPALPLPSFNAFIAFAYRNSGGTQPQIIDVTYPTGVHVTSDGTFRIADIPAGAAPYKIAVWADTNGNGVIDAGDSFGVVATNCAQSGPCSGATAVVAKRVASGFVLP